MTWSLDAFSSDFNVDMTNPSDVSDWNIPVTNGYTYDVKGFWFYVWDTSVNINFGQYSVVWYNGYFWTKITAGTVNPSTGSPAPDTSLLTWVPLKPGGNITFAGGAIGPYVSLTEEDIYEICTYSIETASEPINTASGMIEIDCPPFTVTKDECHQWTISITANSISSASLLDYSMDEIVELTTSTTSVSVNLDDYGDGAYIVKVIYTDNVDTFTAYIPIFDLCDAYDCYINLFKYNLCKCSDPCDDCDEDLTSRKYDEESIRILIDQIKQMIYLDKYQYIGIYSIDTTRNDMIEDIGSMIDKLKIITDRCGLCDETMTNEIDC